MNDHRPREIQLTSKQLVFVFMSTVLVAVVVFLLGVWVGRGIDTGSMAATEDVVSGGLPKAEPPTPPSASPPLTYPGALAGADKGAAASSLQPPAPPAADPPASSTPGPSPAPPASSLPAASPPREKPQPQAEKPQPAAEKPQAAAAKPPALDADSWVVQVGAFSARSGAEKVAAEFKGKGYPVTLTPGPTFKVWLGPYPKKADADQLASRLRKEGKDASVTKPR